MTLQDDASNSRSTMKTEKRVSLAIVGGVFGAIVGPLVGVLLIFNDPMGRTPMALWFTVIRSWLVPIIIFVVPPESRPDTLR
jgi:hypothetical protein